MIKTKTKVSKASISKTQERKIIIIIITFQSIPKEIILFQKKTTKISTLIAIESSELI